MAELTPMMQQYNEIKEQHQDCILFFRLGDFYEMFAQDATIAAAELDLTLTSRDKSKPKDDPSRIPMCGIPYHSSESYIGRLVGRGYKVAICEQVEDPAEAKGLVRRDVVRIITPGTVTESTMLEENKNNYFACLYPQDTQIAMAFADISTGSFFATSVEVKGDYSTILSQLERFSPAEILLGGDCQSITPLLQEQTTACITQGNPSYFQLPHATHVVETQFDQSVANLEIDQLPCVIQASGALLSTLYQLQKSQLTHIRTFEYFTTATFLALDLSAQRNLELTQTLRGKERKGSLLWVMDKTKTPMGSRLLRTWLEKPLVQAKHIKKRHQAVAEFVSRTVDREELALSLKSVCDLERIMSRMVGGTANGRDMVALANGCRALPAIYEMLQTFHAPLLTVLTSQLDTLQAITQRIDRAIVDDPPFTVREGKLIRPGYSEAVDRLQKIMNGGSEALLAIELAEKEKTGIRTMKVGYNRVFGYYIEVSKNATAQVPETYIRKQTLANCERYITPDLKDLEHTILTAKDQITAVEYDIFNQLRQWVAAQIASVQQTASAVATVDVLLGFAQLAVKQQYCCPEMDMSQELHIVGGRHPVVEQVLKREPFVPNDTDLGGNAGEIAIITGPNMAGKSTYMRQVALISIMAQMGSFVPATQAHLGVVDKVFTRIGASDDLASGQSTFMVEMTEVSTILSHATPRSLLILDEVGRGTSTFDGMAIAKSVVEYLAKKVGAKTLFATHYHQLTAMDQEFPSIRNYNIAVKKRQGSVVFLRKIIPGGTDDSFGIDVAKLAGLPAQVITRARSILTELEAGQPTVAPPQMPQEQMFMGVMEESPVMEKLKALNVDTMSPIEALNALYHLKALL